MLKIAVLGCGAIGRTLLSYLDSTDVEVDVCAVLDRDVETTRSFVSTLRKLKPKVTLSLEEILEEKPDVIIEAASPEAVKQYIPAVAGRVKHIVIMSVSALADSDFLIRLVNICRATGTHLHIPSGAAGGIDLVKAHALCGLKRILLTTRKSPRALGIESLSEERVVYEGNVVDAVRKYPRNVNIYATIMIASNLQIDKIWCRIVADPKITSNIHEIEIESELGRAYVRLENMPSEINPRTSKIAAYSLIRKILELVDPYLDIGT